MVFMHMKKQYYIFDADSTLLRIETLEELAKITLRGNSDAKKILDSIEEITLLGMEGKIPFPESLQRRMAVLPIKKQHIYELTGQLFHAVTPSVVKNREFIQRNRNTCYVVSGGFSDYLIPVLCSLGFRSDHIYANSFVYAGDTMAGIDEGNELSREAGKVRVIESCIPDGIRMMVGDGSTDAEPRTHGVVDHFIAFTENVRRESVVGKADFVACSFDDVLSYFNEKENMIQEEAFHKRIEYSW